MRVAGGLSAVLLGAAVVIVQPLVVKALTATEVYAIAQQITVRIDGANTGSGLIVERQGNNYTVVTNWHVVQLEGNYRVQTPDGKQYNINHSQVRQLSGVDLAMFQFTSNQNYRVAEKGNSDQVTVGKTIHVAGYPEGTSDLQFLSGSISSLVRNPKDGYALVYTVNAFPGMSGGPILDEQGKLVGIHGRVNTRPDTNATTVFGIPLKTYLNLASVQRAKPPQPISSQPPKPTKPVSTSRVFKETPKELIDEVWAIVYRQYLDANFNQVDWLAVRREYLSKSYRNKQEVYKSIREMLNKLNDSYTRFMDPEEFKNLQVDNNNKMAGIGVTIRLDETTKKLTVIAAIEDTPAFNAGLLAKDIIIKINGKSTEGMDTNEAVSLFRGKSGTTVNLTILRNGQQKQFTITREQIEIHPLEYSLKQTPVGNIGYIRLKQFSANAAKEMRVAIENLESKQVSGYILDLRNNPGGLLFVSVDIARMWMNQGAIVSTIDRKGELEREVANGRALTNKPLVVLVDNGSASASEILSGALQDNKRAVLVGSKTFGAGLIQSVRPLDDGSGLAVTIAKYQTPSGRQINKLGISPDVVVDLNDQQRQALWINKRKKVATLADSQFAKAVDVLGKLKR